MTHHDLWDFDSPTAPILVDITVEGRPIKAVAQLTKQGFISAGVITGSSNTKRGTLIVFDQRPALQVWYVESN